MFIQNVVGEAKQGRLQLRWTIHCGDAKAISVQIAEDREFTKQRKHFVLPVTTSCALSTGAGMWFYRVGVWSGDLHHGVIGWSGIYGPITIATPLAPKPNSPFPLKMKSAQPIVNGIQYYTDVIQRFYGIIEISKTDLRASQTVYQYMLDDNKGFVAASNLSDHLQYMIRISVFDKNISDLPSSEVIECTEGKVFTDQKSLKPQVFTAQVDRAQFAGGAAILQQEKEGKPIRFHSAADYTRYMAMKAITEAKKQNI